MRVCLLPPEKPVRVRINLPASKSISNRVLILRALSRGDMLPENLSDCDDTRVLLAALARNHQMIDIGAAGTAMRFLTAYFSLVPGIRLLSGTERMKNRPVKILVDALRQIGASIEYEEKEGYPPLRITGRPLAGGVLTVKGNISSQYISALLMIAPLLKNGLELILSDEVVSKPYIDLTLNLMKQFGAKAEWLAENRIRIPAQPYHDTPYRVESDWSAASYWYEIALFSGAGSEIVLSGLSKNSYQGDRKIVEMFALLGISTEFIQQGILLKHSQESLKYLECSLVDQPDLAQTLVVACLLKGIPFRFTGLQSLKIKETDRIQALINESLKLGYVLHQSDNSILWWEGEQISPPSSPVICTYQDHRMAMAFAPAALKFPSLRIENPQVVDKSYPAYWEDLARADFKMYQEL